MRSGKFVFTGVSVGKSEVKKISKNLIFPIERSMAEATEFFDFLRDDRRFKAKLSKKVNDIVAGFPASFSGAVYRCPDCEPGAPPVTGLVVLACREGNARRVFIECSKGHWAAYSCAKCSLKNMKSRKK